MVCNAQISIKLKQNPIRWWKICCTDFHTWEALVVEEVRCCKSVLCFFRTMFIVWAKFYIAGSQFWIEVSGIIILPLGPRGYRPVWSQDSHGHVYVGGNVNSVAIQIFHSWEAFRELESSIAPCSKWAASWVTRVLVCVCLCTQSIHPFPDSIKDINSEMLNDQFSWNSVWIW